MKGVILKKNIRRNEDTIWNLDICSYLTIDVGELTIIMRNLHNQKHVRNFIKERETDYAYLDALYYAIFSQDAK